MRYLLVVLLLVPCLFAQTVAQRPLILGLAHVAFRVSDLVKTGVFYKDVLGYAEPFSLTDENGKAAIALVKVTDEQYVELLQGGARSQGQLDHFALYTNDLAAMRAYLLSQRVPLSKDIHQGRAGNPFLTIHDPDGRPIEIVQYSLDSLTGKSQGKFMPASRVSEHITHVGILVNSEESAMRFYRDVLGFHELSRGGGDGKEASWINMQAPDSSDCIELIPVRGFPSRAARKAQNHLGLSTSNVRKTVASLKAAKNSAQWSSSIKVQTGDSLPARTNLFDPDGVRIEIMEPVPAVSSSPVAVSHR